MLIKVFFSFYKDLFRKQTCTHGYALEKFSSIATIGKAIVSHFHFHITTQKFFFLFSLLLPLYEKNIRNIFCAARVNNNGYATTTNQWWKIEKREKSCLCEKEDGEISSSSSSSTTIVVDSTTAEINIGKFSHAFTYRFLVFLFLLCLSS